jgi:TPR repeat protein
MIAWRTILKRPLRNSVMGVASVPLLVSLFFPLPAPADAGPARPLIPPRFGLRGHPFLEGMLLVSEQKLRRALPFLKASAVGGNATAAVWVAKLLAQGAGGVAARRDALAWAAQAAAEGDPKGLVEMGRLSQVGIGVRESSRAAGVLFAWAALDGSRAGAIALDALVKTSQMPTGERHHLLAMFKRSAAASPAGELALSRVYGTLAKRVPSGAIPKLIRAAAMAGDSQAMAEMGGIYQFGVGLPRNVVLAIAWYKKGAKAGNAFAMDGLSEIYRGMLGARFRNPRRAAYYLREAALHGGPDAMTAYGLQLDGLGQAGIRRGLRWELRAMALGAIGSAGDVKVLRVLLMGGRGSGGRPAGGKGRGSG